MKNILTIFLIAVLHLAIAQEDKIPTTNGDISIQPVLHGTLVLSWNNEVIYADPYGGAERFAGIDDPSIILITDIHGDHLNLKTLENLKTINARFFVPKAVFDKLPEEMQSKATVIENGQTIVFKK